LTACGSDAGGKSVTNPARLALTPPSGGFFHWRTPLSTQEQRTRMAKSIVEFEARRDPRGRLAVYHLPAGDGGGRYEVAGINDRYHKAEVDHVVALIEAGRHDEAEAYIVEFIADYTHVVVAWSDDPGVEFYLRDCAFNRGPRGAARILQRAVGVPDDGEVGPQTRSAIAAKSPEQLLMRLRAAREEYERDVVHRDESSKFWRGLVNRWDNALTIARKFGAEKAVAVPEVPAAPAPSARLGWVNALIAAAVSWFTKRKPTAAATLAPAKSASPQGASAPSEAGPPWLAKAASYIGFQERGENRGIEELITLAKCGSVGDPWCAIFVNACLEAVGIRGTSSAMARSFERDSNFVRLSGPALGAITTMWRGSPSSGTGHVFFYLGENNKGVLALGGNQSDRVCRQYEPRDRVVGYWWPKSVPAPKTGKIAIRDDGARVGGSEA
jgi:uncharacterized protein (TIGR02594 family)